NYWYQHTCHRSAAGECRVAPSLSGTAERRFMAEALSTRGSEIMVQMQTTGAELSKLDDGLSAQVEAASIQNSNLPTQVISFAIGDDQYGVDIMAVREIKGWSEITHLPKQPEYVRGVLNLRGVIVPIIDLRCRFGQGLTDATALHIVIIVQIASRQV